MRLLLVLPLFLFSPKSFSVCSDSDQIKNEYIITGSEASQTASSFSFKTKSSEEYKILKKLNQKKEVISFSSKTTTTESNNTLSTMLVKASSKESLQKNFPNSHIQPNCKIKSFGVDPHYQHQSFFQSINFSPYSTRSAVRDVIVAVSDTGVNTEHPDLKENMWINLSELNGQAGVDDDGNGFIDDVHGFDVADNDPDPIPKSSDLYLDYDHGTHVAGLISARVNNSEGIAGVGGNSVKIMAIKGFKSNAETNLADLIASIYYAVNNGAQIINASWGAEKAPEAAEIAAINYATQNGVLVVAAAGNSNVPADWITPAAIDSVLTVGSLNSRDQLSTFSNYGPKVDLLAVGGDGSQRFDEYILSTGLKDNYIELRGTSMAAPIVSGAIAHLMSIFPNLTVFQAVHALKASANNLNLNPFQKNKPINYKKINIGNAINYIESNQNIPEDKPQIMALNSFTRDLASSSNGSSGCGMVKSNAKPLSNSKAILLIFLLVLPMGFQTRIKKGLLQKKGPLKK